MKRLEGKRVLITGGARGIGLAIARRFTVAGAEACLADLDVARLEEAASELRAAGATVSAHRVDVTDPASVAALRTALLASGGPIDVLVNNAGIVHGGAFVDTPLERHRTTYEVNLLGVVGVTHAFLGDLVARPESHLVQIASASGFIGLPYGSTYASSKWGVIGFSESIRLELALLGHRHVGVTTVCPSYVDTGLFAGARPPRTTRMLTPERLATLVVRAVQRNRALVLTPWLVKITPATRALLPLRLFDRVAWMLGSTQSMMHWRGHREPTVPGGQERGQRGR